MPILPDIAISVQTDLPDGHDAVPPPEWCAGAIRHGLAQVLPNDAQGQVSLLIADDATVRELNREYRGLDETTDVLSFSAEHAGHWEGDEPAPSPSTDESDPLAHFPIPTDEPPPLGDIVVSLPQAERQAGQQNVPLCRELALLLVHGALHLLGHDHYDDGERGAMQELEQRALAGIFGPAEG